MSRRSSTWRTRVWRSCLVWGVLGLLHALDARHGFHVARAEVFSFFISALGVVWDAAQVVYDAIETALIGAVGWLVTSVAWLAARIGDIVVSTGSIFSKTWDALKGLWGSVLEPLLGDLDCLFQEAKAWLTNELRPLIDWATAVRDELKAIYKTFVAPVLAALNVSAQTLNLLAALHIPLAATLDSWVNDIRGYVTEGFQKINGYVNLILDTLDGFFTAGGLFQKVPFLGTVERDAFNVWNVMVNSKLRPLSAKESYTYTRALEYPTLNDAIDDTGQWLAGGQAQLGAVDDAVATWDDVFGSSDSGGATA